MRKVILPCLTVAVFSVGLSGCIPGQDDEPGMEEASDETGSVLAPSVEVEEDYYRGLSPLEPSQTRGRLYQNLSGQRLDADRLELGLLEIAQEQFPTDEYLFREGQFITGDMLSQWLQRADEDNPHGLIPEEAPSSVLSHVLEHNYMDAQGEELAGIVIGLSLDSVHYVARDEDSGEEVEVAASEEGAVPRYYEDEELRIYGQEMGQEIVQRMRQNENVPNDVPIFISLYKAEEASVLVPGNFLSVGEAEAGSADLSNWQTINEVYQLFPSRAAQNYASELHEDFQSFQAAVQDFFPHHVGVVGTGRFIDNQMVEMTVEVTVEVASKTETIQLTQFIGGEAIETFPDFVHLNVYVSSMDRPQSVLIRPIDGETIMHVYR